MISMLKGLRWKIMVSRRFLSNRRMRDRRLPSILSIAGIAVGVAALIIVLSVMNGFQMGFIEDILEIRSFHVRISSETELPVDDLETIARLQNVISVYEFREGQTLAAGAYSSYEPIELRGVPENIREIDAGFLGQIEIEAGSFALQTPGMVVLGSELADSLGVGVGGEVSVISLVPSASFGLIPDTRQLVVTGVFKSGYYEIDTAMAFCSLDTYEQAVGGGGDHLYGIKLQRRFRDDIAVKAVTEVVEDVPVTITGWRDFNRAFFGALRMEKLVMTLLLGLIFIVVAVNIGVSLRRSVSERLEAISVLKTIGSSPGDVRFIFVLQGMLIGVVGSFGGVLSGLLIVSHIDEVFRIGERLYYGVLGIIGLFIPGVFEGTPVSIYTSSVFYITGVPVRVLFGEVFFSVVAALVVSVAAAFLASREVSHVEPHMVLRYE